VLNILHAWLVSYDSRDINFRSIALANAFRYFQVHMPNFIVQLFKGKVLDAALILKLEWGFLRSVIYLSHEVDWLKYPTEFSALGAVEDVSGTQRITVLVVLKHLVPLNLGQRVVAAVMLTDLSVPPWPNVIKHLMLKFFLVLVLFVELLLKRPDDLVKPLVICKHILYFSHLFCIWRDVGTDILSGDGILLFHWLELHRLLELSQKSEEGLLNLYSVKLSLFTHFDDSDQLSNEVFVYVKPEKLAFLTVVSLFLKIRFVFGWDSFIGVVSAEDPVQDYGCLFDSQDFKVVVNIWVLQFQTHLVSNSVHSNYFFDRLLELFAQSESFVQRFEIVFYFQSLLIEPQKLFGFYHWNSFEWAFHVCFCQLVQPLVEIVNVYLCLLHPIF
jgi:hypothetical protein